MLSILKRALVIIGIISCMLCLQAIANTHSNGAHNFLVITDPHLNTTTHHHMDFNPTEKNTANDLDSTTFDDLIGTIKSNIPSSIPQPEFILLLGDVAQHDPNSRSETAADAQAVFQKIQQTFAPIPVLYIFGNNDSLDTHYGPFYATDAIGSWHSVYDIATDAEATYRWEDGFLSTGTWCQTSANTYPCLIAEDKILGHYSVYLQSSLRFIGINSIVFAKDRQHLTEADAQTELTWISGQLRDAANNHESILLAIHIPLGLKLEDDKLQWDETDHASFLQLVDSYKNNIIGILAAHTHMEELKMLRTALHHNVMTMLNSPSLCTYSANAPAVKTYYYRQSNSNWELYNADVFYISSNLSLTKLFDYNSYYCNDSSKNITDCLANMTLSQVNTHYNAGNNRYNPTLLYPDALYIDLPAADSQSDSSNNLGTVAAVAAVAAVAGTTAITAHQMTKAKK